MPETIIRGNTDLALNQVQLRTNDVLQQDEWKQLDTRVQNAARIPLRAFTDLLDAGMVFDLGEEAYMATTQLDFQNLTEMGDAQAVMDAITQTEYDRQKYSTFSAPLPLIVREFSFSSRNLAQSRKLGQPLDTAAAESSIFKVSEFMENVVVNGLSDFSFKGNGVEGFTNATNRILASFKGGTHWGDAAKSGEDMLEDLLTVIAAAEAQKFFGPYMVYVPRDASTNLSKDFKSNSDKTIRERLEEVDGINGIKVLDKLASDNLILIQMTPGNSVEIIRGFDPRVVEWETRGGFVLNFMAIAGNSVRIHTDAGTSKSPIVHMT